ncbi:enoyl-CoA hydratase/isomerase family protein [Arenibacterium sp. CAU 1754]
MGDIDIRIRGYAGRITLTRPAALNAMTYDMCMAIDAALKAWRNDDAVALVVIDAAGDKAFCAGGDIAELYATGTAGNYDYGRKFWHDEYRLNAMMAEYPKPIVSLLQGFTMGGGVGIGCHGSHRIVGETSRIAMPECGIGLVPDVGGSYLLARAPGHLGEYLGTTAARMAADDAIYAGFADVYVPQSKWNDLVATLETSGDIAAIEAASEDAPEGTLRALQDVIDAHFSVTDLREVLTSLEAEGSDFAQDTLKAMRRNSPLSMSCAIETIARLRKAGPDMRRALELEYRFTWRAMEHGDFLEGIRAAIIDKDRAPKWQYADGQVPQDAIASMLAPLRENELTFEGEQP